MEKNIQNINFYVHKIRVYYKFETIVYEYSCNPAIITKDLFKGRKECPFYPVHYCFRSLIRRQSKYDESKEKKKDDHFFFIFILKFKRPHFSFFFYSERSLVYLVVRVLRETRFSPIFLQFHRMSQ